MLGAAGKALEFSARSFGGCAGHRRTWKVGRKTLLVGRAECLGGAGLKQQNAGCAPAAVARRLGCFLANSCCGVRPNSTICTRRASRMTGSCSCASTCRALLRAQVPHSAPGTLGSCNMQLEQEPDRQSEGATPLGYTVAWQRLQTAGGRLRDATTGAYGNRDSRSGRESVLQQVSEAGGATHMSS